MTLLLLFMSNDLCHAGKPWAALVITFRLLINAVSLALEVKVDTCSA
uniref:Uncharacterized protein n=1 Tax=Arundo donax TaxID=35708 RepID=A0A0A8YQZ1_ARUDO